MKPTKQFIILTLLCFVFANFSYAADEFDVDALPVLGNSDQQYLTQQQAQQIGNEFYNQAMLSPILIDDFEINDYLRSLITRLYNTSQFSGTPIRIIMINNSEINAFALPGNIIVVHSGLFLAVQKESELVGVLAHELSHLKQQHLLRLLAEQQKNQPKLLLAMFAALLASNNAQTNNAILTAGIASTVQSTLDYTRKQEYEADRIAIDVLVKAQFDPKGISDFFEILLQKSGFSTDLASGSEFLRTHPLSENRIAEAKNRIQGIDTRHLSKDSATFQRLKIKLAALLDTPIKSTQFRCYQQLLNAKKQRRNGQSIQLNTLTCPLQKPQQYIQHEYSNVLSLYGKNNAEQHYLALIKRYPEHLEFQYSLLEHEYRNYNYAQYIKVAETILSQSEPLFPNFYQRLSRVYFKNQQPDLAKFYLSKFYYQVGKNTLAQRILQKLMLQESINLILKHKVKTLLSNIPDEETEDS